MNKFFIIFLGLGVLKSPVYASTVFDENTTCSQYLVSEKSDNQSNIKDITVAQHVNYLGEEFLPITKKMLKTKQPKEIFERLIEATHQECVLHPEKTLSDAIKNVRNDIDN